MWDIFVSSKAVSHIEGCSMFFTSSAKHCSNLVKYYIKNKNIPLFPKTSFMEWYCHNGKSLKFEAVSHRSLINAICSHQSSMYLLVLYKPLLSSKNEANNRTHFIMTSWLTIQLKSYLHSN